MISKLRRLIRLYQLLWVSDRLTAVESRRDLIDEELGRVKQALLDLESKNSVALADTYSRADYQAHQLSTESARITEVISVVKMVRDQLDTLKSSLEVPQELIDEFFDWKSRNPIPAHPLVSVIVLTYDRPRLLTERCLPSIRGQTYDKLELIVVGDGCTDETEELVSQIKDPRLKFYNMPEHGKYPSDPMRRWMVAGTPAANKAFSLAQGDFITHLDEDDEYVLDRLEKLVQFAIANQCDFVWHPFWWQQGDGSWIINEATELAHAQVTGASTLYRGWFKKLSGDINAYRLMEPGDWNRYRRMKYFGSVAMRYPEPLLRHYQEQIPVRVGF